MAAAMATVAAGWAADHAVAPPAPRQSELLYLLRQDCGSCHGLTLKGGLGPPLLPEALAARSDEDLVAAIVEGRPGTPMPPWGFEISRDEAAWLVRRLREGL
ncbi:MAG: cytochrome c [Alphaproteobacteria bacterium]|nr:MAG: cytochrome c [Alphaproteobacteria bacterium]